jgi:hypothetical protein
MAVKVTPARTMNMVGNKVYEEATSYKRDNAGYLTVLNGTRKVAEHAAGTWESVEIFTPLDQKIAEQRARDQKAAGGEKAPEGSGTVGGSGSNKVTSREGKDIRTSPHRAGPRKAAKKSR